VVYDDYITYITVNSRSLKRWAKCPNFRPIIYATNAHLRFAMYCSISKPEHLKCDCNQKPRQISGLFDTF